MLGLSLTSTLTSTVAARDAEIATLRAERSAAHAMVDQLRDVARATGAVLDSLQHERADEKAAYRELVAKLYDFVDRSLPPPRSTAPLTQPKSTVDADRDAAKRFRDPFADHRT